MDQQVKICTKCKMEKPFEAFRLHKRSKNGLRSQCRECETQYSLKWIKNHPEEVKILKAKHYQRHKEEINKKSAAWHKLHPGNNAIATAKWRKRNPEKSKWYTANWAKNNPDKVREKTRRHDKKVLATPEGKLANRMHCAVWNALRDNKAGRHWELLVGYTLADLKQHLESKFATSMTWNNMGKWDIHHIKEQNTFHYKTTDDKEFKQCWALNNLTPMWHDEHMKLHNTKS